MGGDNVDGVGGGGGGVKKDGDGGVGGGVDGDQRIQCLQ